jgi:glycosyltransferase involved in cell wall biosynthesis
MLEIPTIASRVGEYQEIEHGVTGMLARDEIEWEFYMEQLIKDAELRKSIGKQAKQYTLEHNSIGLNIKQYDRVYREIIENYKNWQQVKSLSTVATPHS